MSTWSKNIKPEYSSHIRVNRGLYCHHGIYLSDDCVVQFGGTGNDNVLDPANARIIIVTLDEFLRGGILEVREYNEEEKVLKRSPKDIANYALSQLGRGGYDLINNNCEHFANECVFGKKMSEQVNNVQDILSKIFRGF